MVGGAGAKILGSCGVKLIPSLTAGLLEDERLASAQQAEVFTKQIQGLQGNPPTQTEGTWPTKSLSPEDLPKYSKQA